MLFFGKPLRLKSAVGSNSFYVLGLQAGLNKTLWKPVDKFSEYIQNVASHMGGKTIQVLPIQRWPQTSGPVKH